MSHNKRVVRATPTEVWAVLADGRTYADWVVGAERIRDVEPQWPTVGARLFHSVSAGPADTDDVTVVLESTTDRHLKLEGHARPYGTAHITIELRPVGAETEVAIEERVVDGPGSHLPDPIQDVALKARNVQTLRKLAHIVESDTI